MSSKPKAVVLLSGGLDSTTALAIASQEFACCALTVSYGQLHALEVAAAERAAKRFAVLEHRVLPLDLRGLARSALTSPDIALAKHRSLAEISQEGDVPTSYVPARNTLFLSLALAWTESLGAQDIFLGVNVLDASGYPDCRPEFVAAFQATGRLGTTLHNLTIHAPLVKMTKADIIRRGMSLGVNYAETHSCYDPATDGAACGACDACILRRKGFHEAGVPDPTKYRHA